MQTCKKKQEDEIAALNKEVIAMTIMKLNYDQMVADHHNQPGAHTVHVPDHVKLQVVSFR